MDYQLLIQPLTRSHARVLKFFKIRKIVQNHPFAVGVRIKNIGKEPFTGANIQNLMIRPSSESKGFSMAVDKTIQIGTLNPDKHVDIWLDKFTSPVHGPHWIEFKIVPQAGDKVLARQWDGLNNEVTGNFENQWRDLFYITNESSMQQGVTNYLVLTLTIILLVDQIFGMKSVIITVLRKTGFVLTKLLEAIIQVLPK